MSSNDHKTRAAVQRNTRSTRGATRHNRHLTACYGSVQERTLLTEYCQHPCPPWMHKRPGAYWASYYAWSWRILPRPTMLRPIKTRLQVRSSIYRGESACKREKTDFDIDSVWVLGFDFILSLRGCLLLVRHCLMIQRVYCRSFRRRDLYGLTADGEVVDGGRLSMILPPVQG